MALLLSFLIGHFISQIGAWCEDLYWEDNESKISEEYPKMRQKIKTILEAKDKIGTLEDKDVRNWSIMMINVTSKDLADRIERKKAERRLFRNIFVVFCFSILMCFLSLILGCIKIRTLIVIILIFSVCTFLSYKRYHYQSRKYTKEIFNTLLSLDASGKLK